MPGPEEKILDTLAVVAHEFQSPVTTIHTTIETLLGGYFGALNPEQKQALETVLRNCEYLEDAVLTSLELGRMEWGQLGFALQPTRLESDVLAPVLDSPEYQANRKKMNFVKQFDPIPEVCCDPKLMRIVVNNLVNNAIKYGNAGSNIVVRVSREHDEALVSVRNEGPGIGREDIEKRLFQRFSRLKQKGTEGVKGSGLGLYLCKQIVDKHGGRIEVLSEPGEYAEFVVRLKY